MGPGRQGNSGWSTPRSRKLFATSSSGRMGRDFLMTPDEVNGFVAIQYPAVSEGGFSCEETGEGVALARWRHQPEELRPGGLISGVTQFTLCDLALWFATFTVIGLEAMALTADMSIRFLRPAKGGDLLGRATLVHSGRNRLIGEIALWVDGAPERLVGHATGSYAPPRKEETPNQT
ncbi:MAG: hotdog fold thioesterase [Acidimicrobiia bacterium]|nr:hotdog fold thioesterase [Acidimicrobiia bacterium]